MKRMSGTIYNTSGKSILTIEYWQFYMCLSKEKSLQVKDYAHSVKLL